MINLKAIVKANKNYVLLQFSNKIKYTIFIENLGMQKAYNTILLNYISPPVRIIRNSIKINNEELKQSDLSNEIKVGDIEAFNRVCIEFEVEIEKCKDFNKTILFNKVNVIFEDQKKQKHYIESNNLQIPIVNVNLLMHKSAQPKTISSNGKIRYDILIENKSNIDLRELVFHEMLAKNLTLVKNSIMINNEKTIQNSLNNLMLGDLKKNKSVIISFIAKINFIESDVLVSNKSTLVYRAEFETVNKNIKLKYKSSSNTVENFIDKGDKIKVSREYDDICKLVYKQNQKSIFEKCNIPIE